jgi:hypothetical protein
MQFTEPYLGLYSELIKKVAESDRFKLNAYHAGEALGRVVLQDIVRGIEEAKVVIADAYCKKRVQTSWLRLAKANCERCGRLLTFYDFIYTGIVDAGHPKSFVVHTLLGVRNIY